MDAKSIKVNCAIPGPALTGCHDLCRVLTALGQLIIDNGGQGFPLSVVLTPINRNAPSPAPSPLWMVTKEVIMLGQYVHVQRQAQQAVGRLTGKISACTYPLFYCQAGQIAGYALATYVASQKQKQTLYFDATWQPLTAAPAGAQPCCKDRKIC